jgi:hypothetical protein
LLYVNSIRVRQGDRSGVPFHRAVTALAAAAISCSAAACRSTNDEYSRPSRSPERLAEAGKHLSGNVGIIIVEMTEEPRLRRPSTGGDVFSSVSGGFTSAAGEVAMSEAMFFAPAVLAMAPVAGIASSPMGVNGAKTAQNRDVLRKVYTSQDPCSNIRDALMDRIRELGGRPVFIRRETPSTTTWIKRDSAYYRELAIRGIPAVLIVEFWGHTLEGPEGSNPRLTVDTRLDGWVMNTSTTKTIGTATVTHRSQRKQRYARWAEADGIAFSETMAKVGDQVAGELIAELRP